jgi:hypothetical protein
MLARFLLPYVLPATMLVGCIDVDGLTFGPAAGAGSGPGGGPGSGAGGGDGGGGRGGAGGEPPEFGYRELILEDTPAAYYRMNEMDGYEFFDESPNGRHALLEAGFQNEVERDLGGALIFDVDGATRLTNGASVLVVPNSFGFAADGAYTVEAWVRVDDTTDTSRVLVFSTTGGQTVADFNTFFGATGVTHKRHDEFGGYEQIDAERPLAVDFHHVVVTFDGSDGQLYVDGLYTFTVPQPLDLDLPEMIDPVLVAAVGPSGNVVFDEVAFYARALLREEVEQHYDCGRDGRCVSTP